MSIRNVIASLSAVHKTASAESEYEEAKDELAFLKSTTAVNKSLQPARARLIERAELRESQLWDEVPKPAPGE